MVSRIQIEVYEDVILSLSNAEKQEYGQDIVAQLGAIPGPRGPDDGVDGWYEPSDGENVYFQVKLSILLASQRLKSCVPPAMIETAARQSSLAYVAFHEVLAITLRISTIGFLFAR